MGKRRSLVMDPMTQPRVSMDVNIVHEYSVAMKEGTNARHGVRRTSEDKRRVVTMLLNDER